MAESTPPASPTDLSGGTVPPDQAELTAYVLKQASDAIWYRRVAFVVCLGITGGGYWAFLYFVFCRSWYEIGHERLILAAILATIPTILLLALVRFAFAEKGETKDTNDVSIWQTLFKELIDAIKSFATRKG